MIRVYQDFDENNRATWGQWFGTLSRGGHVVMNAGPFLTAQECRAFLGDVTERAAPRYSREAVQREILKDPRIGAAEAKAIHALLKGRH